MKRRVLGIAVAVGLVAVPATARATELPGDVAPFGQAIARCNMPPDPSDQAGAWNITQDHVRPLVLVSSTGDPHAGGNADFSIDENDQGVWETYWGKNPVTFWREARTMKMGFDLSPMGMDCATSDLPWRVHARWFDRPVTPATFKADGQSVVGFRAVRHAQYVVDVVPSRPITVAMEEHHTGEYSSVIPEREARGVFDTPGRLELGVLSPGDHDLTVRGHGGCLCHVADLGPWSVTIREAGDDAPSPADPGTEPRRELDAARWRQSEGPPQESLSTLGSRAARAPIVVRRRDKRAPRVALSVDRRRGVRTLRLRCDEHCTLRVVARAARYLRRTRRELRAGRVLAIRVRARGRVRLTAVAVDRGRNRRVLRKLVR
jgi:hypothetical protein